MITINSCIKDGKEARECSIIGSNKDITLDLLTLFNGLKQNERTEFLLLECIGTFLTSRSTEISNEKGDK